MIAGSIGYWLFDNAVLWATFHAFGLSPAITIVLMGYLIGQLGGLLPIPGGIGGIDLGLIGTLIVYGAPAAGTAAAVLAYRVILFWLPLVARRHRVRRPAPRHARQLRVRLLRACDRRPVRLSGRRRPPLFLAGSDAEDRDDLGLVGLRMGDIGARAAAEPAGALVVADEGPGVAPAVAVLDPDRVALLEAVLDRV